MAPGEPDAGEHGGEHTLAEVIVTLRPVEGRHGLPKAVDGLTISALGIVGHAEVMVRQRLQDDLPTGRSEYEGTLAGGNGLVIRAYEIVMESQSDRDLAQPTRVVEGCGQGLGLAQIGHNASHEASRVERCTQGEPEIDGLLSRVASCWQIREGAKRLLEVAHGLAVGRPRQGFLAGLATVQQGFVPYLAPPGVVRQAFDLLSQAVPSERLESFDNLGV
jgi:hypothetical protein